MSLTLGLKDELEGVRRDVSVTLVDEPEQDEVPRRRRVRSRHAELGPFRSRAQQEQLVKGRPRSFQCPDHDRLALSGGTDDGETAAVRRDVPNAPGAQLDAPFRYA